MDSPLVAGIVAIVGGLAVLSIWNARKPGIRVLQKLRGRIRRVLIWPIHRWLGWLSDMPRTTDALWASGDQFNGVEVGNFVSVRAVVHSLTHDFQIEGKRFGWLLNLRVGSERIACFFPKGYKRTNEKYLRRLRGSQRVVIHGKVTSLGDFHSSAKSNWLVLTMNGCHVVGAWKGIEGDQWLRVAGWKEAQVALGRSSPTTYWSRLGILFGNLR